MGIQLWDQQASTGTQAPPPPASLCILTCFAFGGGGGVTGVGPCPGLWLIFSDTVSAVFTVRHSKHFSRDKKKSSKHLLSIYCVPRMLRTLATLILRINL